MSKGSFWARGKSTKARQLTFLSGLQHLYFINDKLKIFTDLVAKQTHDSVRYIVDFEQVFGGPARYF